LVYGALQHNQCSRDVERRKAKFVSVALAQYCDAAWLQLLTFKLSKAMGNRYNHFI
jgi:hypothetical protein